MTLLKNPYHIRGYFKYKKIHLIAHFKVLQALRCYKTLNSL